MRDMRGNRNMALKNLVNQKATMDDTKMLQISHLKEYPDNEYVFGMEGIERLANGIESNGFKGAIEVWDMGDGEYMIYSGARRTRAFQMLGHETIKAFVYPYPESETLRRRLFLGANIYGRDAIKKGDAIHTARQIDYLRKTIEMEREEGTYDGQKTREELAKEFGTKPSTIYKYESLLKLGERAQKAVVDGILQIAQGSSMSVLDEDKQSLILDAMELMKERNIVSRRDEVQELIDVVKDHDGEPLSVEELVEAVCGRMQAETAGMAKAEEAETAGVKDGVQETCEDAQETGVTETTQEKPAAEPKKYTSKAAVKKFNQCYDRMEDFLNTDKKYKEQDREEVLEKLQALKAMIDSEIVKITDGGAR